MKLLNKKVLVLGATGGIGSSIVKQLVTEGARVVITGRNQKKLQTVIDSIDPDQKAIVARYCIDFKNTDCGAKLESIASVHTDIDLVIHALGVNSFGNYNALTDRETESLFSINVLSFMQVSKIFTPNLLKREQAALVAIGSTFGSIGYPGFSAYCSTKFALRGYVESLRRELSHSNLEILYIAPRATNTELNDENIVAFNNAMGNHVDSPSYVASQVIRAIKKDTLNSFLGWPEKLFVRINALSTQLVDRAIYKKIPLINQFLVKTP